MDSSRVSTFLISILLIVYGSFRLHFLNLLQIYETFYLFVPEYKVYFVRFRSLNMEQEAREREKEKSKSSNGSSVCLTDISKRKQG